MIVGLSRSHGSVIVTMERTQKLAMKELVTEMVVVELRGK